MELKKVIYRTVHRKRLSVEEIADEVGCSASLLYRCANPNDPQARFPLEKLLPLMRATNDYSILKHLAFRSGFILYRIPPRIRHDKPCDLNKFQAMFTNTFKAVLEFQEGRKSKEKCLEEIDGFLGSTLEIRKSVEKSEQLRFDFT